MNAQQQLAELIPQTEEGRSISLDGLIPFVEFIRDHGPAIAELIEAVDSHRKDHCSWTEVLAALAKLTEPK